MSTNFDWVRRVRLIIMEAYVAPFWPRIEYEAERLVQAMERVGADTVRFGTIGWGALFQTEHMPPLEDLGERDLLRETVEACHGAGKRVFAYVPVSHWLPRRVAEVHPAWNQRDIEGRPNGIWFLGAPGQAFVYRTCSHGPYRQAIHRIVEQIVREYPVDGMYFDGPQYYRSCYCPWCRESFREFSGLDLPPIRESQPSEGQLAFHPDLAPGLDWDDPAIHVYFDWVAKMDLELVASLNATIKGIRNIPLLAHGSSIMHRTFKAPHLQHALQVDGCLFETGEDFMHRYVVAQLTASVDRAMWSYTGALATHPRVFENAREYAAEAYAAVAAGGTPILSFGNRVYFDKRGDRVVREVFDFLKDHEEDLSGLKSVPYAAVPYSEHTGQWFGRDRPEERYNQVYRSFVACLNNAHVQTNPVLEDKLESVEALRPYGVVCLPQMVCMSDREAEVLREYVAEGGGLVVTGLTGTRNERGLERPDFAVADVLGVCYEGYSAEIYDRYLRIDAEHEMTDGLEVGQLLPQTDRAVVRAGEKTQVIGTAMQYADEAGPGLVLNSYGKGRTAYFASNMATIYARPPERRSRLFDRYPPIRRLVARAVQWAARRPSPIQVEAHPALTATLMSKTGTLTLHLVNYAGPRHDRAHTVTEAFMPISDVPVAVRIPEGARVSRVRMWQAGQDLSYKIEDGWLKVAVPQIEEYEAVAIELAKA